MPANAVHSYRVYSWEAVSSQVLVPPIPIATRLTERSELKPAALVLVTWSRGAALIGCRYRIEHDRDLQRPAEGRRIRASAQSGCSNNLVQNRSVASPVEMPCVPQLDPRRRRKKQ